MFSRERHGPHGRVPGAFEEDRRDSAGEVLGAGTLACPHCDAPVGIGPAPLSVHTSLTCPFCAHHAPLREFLSLDPPTRPTRVIVRVRITAPAPIRS